MPKPFKIVVAAKAAPGQRYLTDKDVVMEMATSADKGLLLSRDEKNVMAYLVVDGKTVRTKLYPVPVVYRLRVPRQARAGRKPYEDHTWRGWAWKNPDLPAALLDHAGRLGYYKLERTHYFALGDRGKTVFAVFRSGHLGVRQAEAKLFAAEGFGVEDVGGRFFPLRLDLSKIMAERRAKELLQTYVSVLKHEADA